MWNKELVRVEYKQQDGTWDWYFDTYRDTRRGLWMELTKGEKRQEIINIIAKRPYLPEGEYKAGVCYKHDFDDGWTEVWCQPFYFYRKGGK